MALNQHLANGTLFLFLSLTLPLTLFLILILLKPSACYVLFATQNKKKNPKKEKSIKFSNCELWRKYMKLIKFMLLRLLFNGF